MSLPPTLLQRLKQRGLVNNSKAKAASADGVEEVIAENYDMVEVSSPQKSIDYIADEDKRKGTDESFWSDRIKERIGVTESCHGYKYCPNKYNIWHKCTLYCVNRWTNTRVKMNEKYIRRFRRLLQKYPLDEGWKEVYDAGCNSYYFYNSNTRKVSWLPPSHPNARISNSAATFRKHLASASDEHSFDTDEFVAPKAKGLTGPDEHQSETIKSTSYMPAKKQKARDLERTLLRKHRNDK